MHSPVQGQKRVLTALKSIPIPKFCEANECPKFLDTLYRCKCSNEDMASNIVSNNEAVSYL